MDEHVKISKEQLQSLLDMNDRLINKCKELSRQKKELSERNAALERRIQQLEEQIRVRPDKEGFPTIHKHVKPSLLVRDEILAICVWAIIAVLSLSLLSGGFWAGLNPFGGKVCIRLDDIQDTWLRDGQIHLMEYCIANKIKITLGVIPSYIGYDQEVIHLIQDGADEGLFEIALHGWTNEDFSKLNYDQQLDLILRGRNKLEDVFSDPEIVTFIPPMNLFNDDTLRVCEDTGFQYFSASIRTDTPNWKSTVKHLPRTVETSNFIYGEDEKPCWIQLSAEMIIQSIKDSLNKYWFAILTVHPQQFYNWVNGSPSEFNTESFGKFAKVLDWAGRNAPPMQIKELGSLGLFGIRNYPALYGIIGVLSFGITIVFYFRSKRQTLRK